MKSPFLKHALMKPASVKTLLLAAVLLPAFAAAAQDASTSASASTSNNPTPADGKGPPKGPPPGGRNPEVDAALSACAQSLGASGGQRPDMAKMDACMSAKGFKKPQGGPPPGGGHHDDDNGAPPAKQENAS
ncbi:MAG: hypothetical protein QM599_00910 [Pseudoxanthomonas sp.]